MQAAGPLLPACSLHSYVTGRRDCLDGVSCAVYMSIGHRHVESLASIVILDKQHPDESRASCCSGFAWLI